MDELTTRVTPSELVNRRGLTNALQLVNYFVDLLVDGDVSAPVRGRLLEYVSSDLRRQKGEYD